MANVESCVPVPALSIPSYDAFSPLCTYEYAVNPFALPATRPAR